MERPRTGSQRCKLSPGKERRIGLARRLSKQGYCSRAQAFTLVRGGRVKLNGKVQRDPERPTFADDRVAIDDAPLEPSEKIYLMMNKPRGLVTTASDEKGRATVYSLLDPGLGWLAPVGRLDKASEGLLLFTNDSDWAARIAAPESHVEKSYHVQIGGAIDDERMGKIREGVGELRAKQVSRLRTGEKNTWLEIVLDEGKNRQIRRIFDALGIEVLRLVRVAVGDLQLGELAKGQVRRLKGEEVASLGKI